MTNEGSEIVVLAQPAGLVPAGRGLPPDKNPCSIYLMSLMPGPSRESTRRVLTLFLRALINLSHIEDIKERRKARRDLRVDISLFPWQALRAKQFDVARANLLAEAAPGTGNRAITAARRVMRRARKEGLISREEYGEIEDVEHIEGDRPLAGRAYEDEEVARVYEVVKDKTDKRGIRDAAMFLLLWGTGCRRTELSTLDLDSWNPTTRQLKIFGKRRNIRFVKVVALAAEALERWIGIRGSTPGPLFYANRKHSDTMLPVRLPSQTAYDRCRRLGREAGIDDLSPHNIRRTFISAALDRDDALVVGRAVGQKDPKVTVKYDRRNKSREDRLMDANVMPTRKTQ